MKTLTLILLGFTLTACNVGYNPRYYYNYVEIANLTGDTIRDLKVQIGSGGRVLACDEVTNNRICSERFGKRPYPKDLVDIRWQDGAGEMQNRQTNPSIPLTLTPGLPVRLLIEIGADGSIKAFFKQDDLRIGRAVETLG